MKQALFSVLPVCLSMMGCTQTVKLGDTTPPSIVIVRPADGSTFIDTVDFCATVLDDAAPEDVTISLNSSTDGVLDAGVLSLCEGGNAGALLLLSEHEQVLTLTATDPDGNQASAAVSIRPQPNRAPRCSFLNPLANASYSAGEVIAVVIRTSDNSPPSQLEVQLSDNGTVITSGTPGANGNFRYSEALATGSHTLSAEVLDTRGGSGSCTTTIEVQLDDTAAPTGDTAVLATADTGLVFVPTTGDTAVFGTGGTGSPNTGDTGSPSGTGQ